MKETQKQTKHVSIKQTNTEDVEMIVAMINRGYADFVIDAARDAGATGATVLYGRGGVNSKAAQLNGVKIQTEKEVILILVDKKIRQKVMQEISDRTHLQEQGNGMSFCIPVNSIMGLTPFEHDSFKK